MLYADPTAQKNYFRESMCYLDFTPQSEAVELKASWRVEIWQETNIMGKKIQTQNNTIDEGFSENLTGSATGITSCHNSITSRK